MAKNIHARKDVRDLYVRRELDKTFPQLKPYLFGGARVLDVGCGPGTITMDVAQVVHPGEVFGIDPVEESIAQADQIKSDRHIENVSFRIGDARELSFQDNEFDVVYAHAVLEWFPEPIKALTEMRRVTKGNGWVVFTVAEEGSFTIYPPCPVYEKVRAVLRKYWTDPEDPDHYYDGQLGRRVTELLKQAGLDNISIENTPCGLRFAQGEPLNIDYYLMWLDYEEKCRKFYKKLFSLGVLDKKTVIEAQNELKNWAIHPYASLIHVMKVIAAGQA